MKRISIAICCLIAILAFAANPVAEERRTDSLSVRIVPTSFRERGGRTIVLSNPSDHFHIIITNTSDKPVRLWRDWCSWGEQTLSFQITDENGKAFLVKRLPREYTKSYPDWSTVPPGDHMVLEMSFNPKAWNPSPLPAEGKSREVKMKAVFEIPEDEDTKKHNVWTGKAESPEQTYTIYR